MSKKKNEIESGNETIYLKNAPEIQKRKKEIFGGLYAAP